MIKNPKTFSAGIFIVLVLIYIILISVSSISQESKEKEDAKIDSTHTNHAQHDFFRWRPHPWHGIDLGDKAPGVVTAYVEITPFDNIKYEIDKKTGYLQVIRPLKTSSRFPSLYGFIPRTYCDERVMKLSSNSIKGDGDPLDICIITESPLNKSEILINAKIIGGLQMVDHGEADDKIIAVLENDNVWQFADDIDDLPGIMIERLKHFFLI